MGILKRKSTIGSILAGLLIVAKALNLIDDHTFQMVGAVIVTFTGVSFRLAVEKAAGK